MNWFEEQLRTRRKNDNENFEESLHDIAAAVMGKRLSEALDDREVSASAITEILKYYHYKPGSDELPPEIKTVDDQLEYRMRPFGIMRRTVKLDKGWYHHAFGPMLGTLKEDGSAVALLPGKLSGYTFLDIKSGKRVRLSRKTEGLLDKDAVCFYKALPMRSLGIPDLLRFIIEQLSISDIVTYLGMMAITALLGMLSPVINKWLFGDVLSSGSLQTLLALASFMVSFSACRLLMSAYQALVSSKFTIKQDIAVQSAVMSRIMSLPPGFFRQYSSGELSQRASYLRSLCSTLMNTIGNMGISSLFSLVYITQIFAYAPAVVVPALLTLLASMVLSIVTTLLQMSVTREKMLLSSKESGLSYSMITGIQKIKLAGAEQRMFARWARHYSRQAVLDYNPPVILKLSGTISLAISLIGWLVIYILSFESGISVADYYAFNAAYGMVSGAFLGFGNIATTLAGIKPTLDMARPIMKAEPEHSGNKQIITSLSGAIELSHVSFRYEESMPNVIDDLSLKIAPGEYVAIVGSTGCGKSTLMRLLLGFETPQKGSIFFDRNDISTVDLKSLRQKVGTVMQDGRLFTGDIFSNIVISAPQLTLGEAWEAAELAAIADDIRAMPMGMNTIISEGQGGISGGQRQRLLIARALAPKPKILLFDEATSALDNVTQRKVSEAIDSLGCTRIVIAHRLSTIRHCDRIIVLDGGKIIEDGTYEELINLGGFFASLVERQRLDVEE